MIVKGMKEIFKQLLHQLVVSASFPLLLIYQKVEPWKIEQQRGLMISR